MQPRDTANPQADLVDALGPERVRIDEPMAPYTTYRIGGPADLFYIARSAGELASAVRLARALRVPCFVLGLGANILVGDRGIRGLVVKNEALAVEVLEDGRLRAESGARVADLIALALSRGLSGLEHFAGIPSTVGGALWQNLHFLAPDRRRTVFIEEVLESAVILSEEGEQAEVDRSYFRFGYDDSVLHTRQDVVLSAAFRLQPVGPERIRAVAEQNLTWRREKHPDLTDFPSAGSVFRKLEGLGAGRLIDQCGLKGATIGQAQVAEKHANFIVNLGGATAGDVRALIILCQQRVREQFGVDLVPEISFIGEF